MAMMVVDDSCLKQADSQPAKKVRTWLGLGVDGRLCAVIHSPDEPSELSQWPRSWWQHYKYRRG